mmetsp:Transcript_24415/g.36225  ORF Transcript_24415/g.36225 Transcript_24415/m.36225 type:complete len:638 (-) Transcript_24415:254-2167(-)|eukprot:CAMPEP_0194216354 /NCGR_PEP_ID=MMETSP0156-20130528/18833_1 /TAXON_ID=33649 /ORGANISM="Thalassionema nitzschioides, Strain L26-B" /LENGTH=637 /DNA_ID=CAMNT_0038945107 /DNA_START=190 /DNA_END=2103 /DNA_ORIENTATION=+
MSRIKWICSTITSVFLLASFFFFADEDHSIWIHFSVPNTNNVKVSSPFFTINLTSPAPTVVTPAPSSTSTISPVTTIPTAQPSIQRPYESHIAWCVLSDTNVSDVNAVRTANVSRVIQALFPCINYFDNQKAKKSGIWLVGNMGRPRRYANDLMEFFQWEFNVSDTLPTNAPYFVTDDSILEGTENSFSNKFVSKTIDQYRNPQLLEATSLQIGIISDGVSENLEILIENSFPNTVVTSSYAIGATFEERAKWVSSQHIVIAPDGNNEFLLSMLPCLQSTTSLLFIDELNNTLGEKIFKSLGGHSQLLSDRNGIVKQIESIAEEIYLDKNGTILYRRTEVKKRQILWCVISNNSMWPKVDSWGWESSIAHSSEALLPCLELFLTRNRTLYPLCGYWLLDDLKESSAILWAKELMSLTDCLHFESQSVSHNNSSYPRHYYEHLFEEEYWFEGRGANLFRPLVLPESSSLDQTHLQIGIIRRGHNRKMSQVEHLESSLKNLSLGVPSIVSLRSFDGLTLRQQAEWFNSQHIIIAVHGAALSNGIFIEPNTTLLQIYPYRYYFKGYYESLFNKMNAYTLEWYDGDVSKAPNPRGQRDATTRKRQEWVNISVTDILNLVQDAAKTYVSNGHLVETRRQITF